MEMAMAYVYRIHAFAATPTANLGKRALSALNKPLVWMKRWRQRRELLGVLSFPDYLLKDIGLQRHQIAQEAVKPFWRP
jgi:uncharacterized protein YjiS (DUF1127 family)